MSLHQVLLLGGDPIYRSGVITTIKKHFPQAAVTSRNCLQSATATNVDSVLVLQVYGQSFTKEVGNHLRRLAKTCQEVGDKLIVIGPFIPLKYCKKFLDRGMRGYLLQHTSEAELIRVIRGVAAGEVLIGMDLSNQWVDHNLGLKQSQYSLALTKRERQVMKLIVEEFTTQEIADRLFISHCTVESHRANIMGKLGVRNVAGLVREAVRRDLYEVA